MRTSAIDDARADVARHLSAPQMGDNASHVTAAFKRLVDAILAECSTDLSIQDRLRTEAMALRDDVHARLAGQNQDRERGEVSMAGRNPGTALAVAPAVAPAIALSGATV